MAVTEIFTKKAQLAMKAEVTPGTYEVPGATDIFLAEIQSIAYNGNNYKPQLARPDFLNMDSIPGPVFINIGYRVPIRGQGAAGTAPEWRDSIIASGHKETIVGGTSVTYTPTSTFDGAGGNPSETYSFSMKYVGGNGAIFEVKAAGGLTTWDLQASVAGAEPAWLVFNYQGAYIAPGSAATFAASNYDATTAPPFRGASLSTNFGGVYVPPGVAALNFTLGNKLVTPRDVSGAQGFGLTRLVGRDSTGSFEPALVTTATKDWLTIQRAGTTGSITMGVIGSVAGNRWQFQVNRSVLDIFSPTDREGIQATSIPFIPSSAVADVEGTNHPWQLALT